MTVYSVLKLNRHSGIGVADERVTRFGQRTYDVAKKIHQLTPNSFVGFSGAASHGTEVIETVLATLPNMKDYSTQDVLMTVEGAYSRVRERRFQTGVLARYGLTMEEFKAGKYDETIKQGLINATNNPDGFQLDMLFGGYDQKKEDFIVAAVAYPGTTYFTGPYHAVGSGADRADLVIGDELAHLPRELRENIPLPLGARILMRATRSAWKNLGVGGSGQVVYVNSEQYNELDPQNVNLLYNLLHVEENGKLPKSFVDSRFEALFEEKTNAEEVLRELEKQLKPEDLLRMFFLESLHL